MDDFVVNVPREEVEHLLPAMFSEIGDETPPDNLVFLDAESLEAFAVVAGLFPSRGQARKNGFAGPFPWGLSLLGTKHRRVWVWSPRQPDGPVTLLPGFDHTARFFQEFSRG